MPYQDIRENANFTDHLGDTYIVTTAYHNGKVVSFTIPPYNSTHPCMKDILSLQIQCIEQRKSNDSSS